MSRLILSALLALVLCPSYAAGPLGYYREPALHGETLIFVAEGDLWKVDVDGGTARRMTTHTEEEGTPAISADGKSVAFVGRYEGPAEAYTMPIDGGAPTRRSYGLSPRAIVGWDPDGRPVAATQALSGLPNTQLVALATGDRAGIDAVVPLLQAADGCWDDRGTLYFTRLPFQGSHTRRYKGGTAQQLWSWRKGEEARPLTADYAGTSKDPMLFRGRIYFASDRDGVMNLWSMLADGGDVIQHTRHAEFEVQDPYLHDGRIVYQHGADIRLFDARAEEDRKIPIVLDSDLDQTRENWVDDPFDYLTASHISSDGERLALTARGKIFVAPVGKGRLVQAGAHVGVRHRDARFMPDGERLLVFADTSGEVELWTAPADGLAESVQLTDDGEILRWEAVPSPDGKWIAHHDKNQRLYLYDVEKKRNREIARNDVADYGGLAWSPDSRWLAYIEGAPNLMARLWIHEVDGGANRPVTTDRYNSRAPAWHPDGKSLYFLSDRRLVSVVPSPWGAYQPEPFLDRRTEIYHLALTEGMESPFAAPHELRGEKADDEKKKDDEDEELEVRIDFEGLVERIERLPVEAGNYGGLTVNDKALFWSSRDAGKPGSKLMAIEISRESPEAVTVTDKANSYEMSADGKKLLLRGSRRFDVVPAKAAKAKTSKETRVDLSGWKLSVVPREEWRQMFDEAWRLERDYFYDPGMHGVDWPAMRDKYRPLVDRVTTRAELSDVLAQMVAELSALHIFVRGGDLPDGEDDIPVGTLGARLERVKDGYRIERIYRADPDEPATRSPLDDPGVAAREGEVITRIDGRSVLDAPDIGYLLRNKAGRQSRLTLRADGESRDAIVVPLSLRQDRQLRYREWEVERRRRVERASDDRFGYVHLRAMGRNNYSEWARDYFPVFDREGLVIDVRHNRGGNIDSWILNRLLRKAWFQWSQRTGDRPRWSNMQYAFRGHVVVLVDEFTASDGEAFAEGIKQLGIGAVIGKRTWGGEIWLTSSNVLVDRGITTAAEFGVYGPDGEWLIEGHGVEPDIVVDNLPYESFNGRDAQLEAAIEWLEKRVAEEPVVVPPIPSYPDLTR